jgi:hypothetical protein
MLFFLIAGIATCSQVYQPYTDNTQISYLPQQQSNQQSGTSQPQAGVPQYQTPYNQFYPAMQFPPYWNWQQQAYLYPGMWNHPNGQLANYHVSRNVWWRCTEDSLSCFHNLMRMVLKASQRPICKSHCAQKCRFPHVPCRIAMLQQVIDRSPIGPNQQSTQGNDRYLAGCKVPRFDGQKEILANIIIQKARTCRVDIGKIERLERIVMFEYESFINCVRGHN